MPPPPPPGAARIKRASGAQHFRMDADDKRKPPAPAEDVDMDDWQSVDSSGGPPPPAPPGAGAVAVAVATPAITQLAQAVQMHTSMLEAMHAERMSANMAQMEAQVQGIQHQLLLERQRQTVPPELVPSQPNNWQAIIRQQVAQGMAFAPNLAVPSDDDPQTAAAMQQQLAALHAAEHAAHFHAGGGNPEKGVKVSELVRQFGGGSGASGSGYPPGDFSHAKVPPKPEGPKFDFSGLARPEKPPERPPKNKREEVSLRKEDYPNTRPYPRPQPRPARRSAAEKRKAVTQLNKERQEGFDQMKAARSEPEPAPKAAPKAAAKAAAQTTQTSTPAPKATPGPNTRATSAPPPRSNRKGNRKFTVTDAP